MHHWHLRRGRVSESVIHALIICRNQQSCRSFRKGNHSKNQQLTQEKAGAAAPKYGHLVYSRTCFFWFEWIAMMRSNPMPALFKPYCRENITTLDSLSKNQLSSVFPVHSECIISSATNTEKCIPVPNAMIREKLRAVVTPMFFCIFF